MKIGLLKITNESKICTESKILVHTQCMITVEIDGRACQCRMRQFNVDFLLFNFTAKMSIKMSIPLEQN